jgi:glycosyltransferase involved in cell wall biosynthesis
VIYGGVDPQAFTPGAATRDRLIVFVGRLLPHKGIDVLIRALPPGARLEIYGRVYSTKYAEDLADLAQGKDVRFEADATDAEIISAYQRARVAVLPSVDVTMYGERAGKTELFGLTLVEAMACGTPVICTSAGAMQEVVEDGKTGFVVPPGDPERLRERLNDLLADDERWLTMSESAIAHVRGRFTWQHVADRAFEAYGFA